MGMGVWLAIGVVGVALAMALTDGDSGLRTWWALRDDLREAESRIATLRTQVAELERDSGGLEADPFALKRAIRERLSFAREGETIVRLSPTGDTSPRIP